MTVAFTITREVDLPTIMYYQKRYPHWTLEEIIDYYFDDNFSDGNSQTIKQIQEAIKKEGSDNNV